MGDWENAGTINWSREYRSVGPSMLGPIAAFTVAISFKCHVWRYCFKVKMQHLHTGNRMFGQPLSLYPEGII